MAHPPDPREPYILLSYTSRVLLHATGEQEYPVPPLPLPASAAYEAIAQSPAVQLFTQRARRAAPLRAQCGERGRCGRDLPAAGWADAGACGRPLQAAGA